MRKLTPTELERLTQEIKAFRGSGLAHGNTRPGSHGRGATVLSDEHVMLDMICGYCRRNALDFRPPERLRASPLFKQFEEKTPAVMRYMRSFCRTKLQMNTVLYMVFDEMRSFSDGILNATTIMAKIHMVPAVLDRMFPGYVQSGLMPVVASQVTGEQHAGATISDAHVLRRNT